MTTRPPTAARARSDRRTPGGPEVVRRSPVRAEHARQAPAREREANQWSARVADRFRDRGVEVGRSRSERIPGVRGFGGSRTASAEMALPGRGSGHDFSKVRIHDDAEAREKCERAGASGLTEGGEIFLGEEAAVPGSRKRAEVLAHELAHVSQQGPFRDREIVEAEPKEERRGIGRTPPEEPFDVVEGQATEDAHVLFPHDSISLELMDEGVLEPLLRAHAGPVVVDLHGYACLEGDTEYNLNLSAHRVVALKQRLMDRLPPRSEVRLFAHGATTAFGEAHRLNRRVGIRITDRPVPATAPEVGPDPETVPAGAEGEVVPPLIPRPGSLGGILDPTAPPPWLDFTRPQWDPLSGFRPDYFELMNPAWLHQRQPTLGEFGSVMDLASRNYLLFRGLLGERGRLPLLGDASDLANLTAGFAYGNQLSLENPSFIEQSNREWETQMKINDPSFWQTPILTKTWYWSFPWERVPSEEERRKARERNR